MAENKTMPTAVAVRDFIAAVQPPARAAEARLLDEIFRETTGYAPRMWGPSIIGYGRYDYRYESGRTGSAPATGFSPRKAEIVIYNLPGGPEAAGLLSRLGRHRTGKSCLYLRNLADADTDVLRTLIRTGLQGLASKWPVSSGDQ